MIDLNSGRYITNIVNERNSKILMDVDRLNQILEMNKQVKITHGLDEMEVPSAAKIGDNIIIENIEDNKI